MAAHVRREARMWDGSGLRASDFRRAASDFRALGHPLAPRTDVWFPVRMRSRFTSLAVTLLVAGLVVITPCAITCARKA